MISIGQFAKRAKVSARTVRYYESIGLLITDRGSNNYRTYSKALLARMEKIRDLQSLGFSLEEIKEIIDFPLSKMGQSLRERLIEVEKEIIASEGRKDRLKQLLSVITKIEVGENLTEAERNLYMEAIRSEIIKSLEGKYKSVTSKELDYLTRDKWFYERAEMSEFLASLQRCMDFAKRKNLILGPGRGSAPASITIYGAGFSSIDPMKYEMVPERLSALPPSIHIDVEYERGQEFVDFCQEQNRKLRFGEIQAFKMPLIDILKNVDQCLGRPVAYDEIKEDSDLVLQPFRNADVEKIFCFDYSEKALVMKYENFFPEYSGLKKIEEYLSGQKIHNFRDVINVMALWRPHSKEVIDRLHSYREAKRNGFVYDFLPSHLQKGLEPNFGRVIYHEEILRIMAHFTGWELGRCNLLRRAIFKNERENVDWTEFRNVVPKTVADLVEEESKWAFCFPHVLAFSQFTKKTAVLKSLHKDVYFSQVEKFEQKHGLAWDDIGIRIKGVSLLQS